MFPRSWLTEKLGLSQRSDHEFSIEPLQAYHTDGVLTLLTEVFGQGFDEPWFDWKHRSGPWGHSVGWVAVDESGVIGIRLLLRWLLGSEVGQFRAFRPCDTATAERARGTGVFRRTTETALTNIADQADLLYNTPNQQSRGGYFKMGFEEWGHLEQSVTYLRRSRAGLADASLPTGFAGDSLSTPITREFLNWRYAACPRYDYEVAGLAHADEPTGIVYRRRQWHGLDLLVAAELWGGETERSALLAAVAEREKTSLVWLADRPRGAIRLPLRKRTTLVTMRNYGSEPVPPPALSVGDVEDVL